MSEAMAPARYRATGKRKTSVARVILRPGDGSTWVNGRTLEEYFPRSVWQTTHGQIPPDIGDVRAFIDRMVPPAIYPHLHEHALQHLEDGPHQDVPAFEYGLDLLLESLERLR